MEVRARPRHGVPGRRAVRFADGARERRLPAVRGDRPCRSMRWTRAWTKCWGSSGSASIGERMPSELSGGQRRRVAIARALTSRAGDPALRRADDRARSDHGADDRRRDHQAARSRGRELDRRHAPAARRVLHRDARGRRGSGDDIDFVPASPAKAARDRVPDAEGRRRRVRGQRRRAARVRRSVHLQSFLS